MASPDTKLTVWHAFYELLRSHGINKIFGNPGSTEQPMLKNFPSDFQYVFGLQEATVVAMADGYAQATRKPAVVSLHTAAGTGNGMGNVMTAFLNKTPLVIIAGQQSREMLIGEPFLTNREDTTLPKPWVKWSYAPVRAEDVPAAVNRAIATAMLPPAGPVYLSIPLDDWDVEIESIPLPRKVSTRIAPDPEQLADFANRIKKTHNRALVLGQEVDKSLGWEAAVRLAELLHIPVFQSPHSERAVFPERHKLFKGALPSARGPLAEKLKSFDLILVVGAEVWRYYPWVPGPVLNSGTELLHITNDPHDAAAALLGESLLSDARLALEGLYENLVPHDDSRSKLDPHVHFSHLSEILEKLDLKNDALPMTASIAFDTLASIRPANAILIQESPSNGAELVHAWPAEFPESYFTFASGGLGWNAPAAVGLALAQQTKKTDRPVIAVIGDGSLQYSIQSLYSAVQLNLKIIYLIPLNYQYAILKEFAELEKTPNVPALDVPGLNAAALASAYGMRTFHAKTPKELQEAFATALKEDGPTLIEFPIDRTLKPLIAQSHPRG